MTQICAPVSITHLPTKVHFHRYLKRFLRLVLLALLTTSLTALAAEETLEVQYLKVLSLIHQADTMAANGSDEPAKRTYREAQVALQEFKKTNPTWNASMVAFRLNYLSDRIDPRPAVALAPVENTSVAKQVAKKPEQKPQPKPASKNVAASAASTVKLISAGAEPRTQLRIRSKAGDKQNLDFTTKMDMDMGTGQSMKMPATKTSMEVTVKSVSAEGDISYEAIIADATMIEEPGVMPQVAQAAKASLNGMKGLSMKGVMSDHGITKSFDIKIPAGVAPQMRQAMEQMKDSLANLSAPFPDEAIGAGAKWEVKLPIKSQGMTIDQVTTYELVSVKDDAAKVTSKITQNAANQKITNPAMPQMKIDLINFTGEGSGDITFNLSKLLPVLATVKSSTETSMSMNVGGQVQEISMEMGLNMSMEAK